MDASLNYGTTINLSQTINAGYGSMIAAGTGLRNSLVKQRQQLL